MLKHRYFTISIIAILLVALIGQVYAATSPTLGAADSFSIIANSTITNTGITNVSGDVGLVAEPPEDVVDNGTLTVGGTIYVDTDGEAADAMAANTAAFTFLDQPCGVGVPDWTGDGVTDLVGMSLVPGTYCADAFTLTGTLTLVGDADDVWIFKSASTLITSGTANVVGDGICNVWWRVASSATLGTNTSLLGNILALTDIHLATGADLFGKAFVQTGEVTLDANTITDAVCVIVQPTAGPRRTATPGTGLPAFPGTGSGAPIFNEVSPWNLLIIGGILAIALFVGSRSLRRNERSK